MTNQVEAELTPETLPITQLVVTRTKLEFTIGRPLMKHRREVAQIMKTLIDIRGGMVKSGLEDTITKVAEKHGLDINDLSKLVEEGNLDQLSDDIQKELEAHQGTEGDDIIPLDDINDIILDAVFVCLKAAPFKWDPKTSTKADLENHLEYGDGFDLLPVCSQYIITSIVKGSDRKKSSSV